MSTYLLGLDVGSTTCRCAIFDAEGQAVAWAAVEGTVRYPRPRWAEVDPEQWWQNTVAVIRGALADAEQRGVAPEQIAGVGLTGLMHAPVLLDHAGVPVAPAMLWMDQRCAPQCDAMVREGEALGIRGARRFGTSLSAPKLRWLAEAQPDVLARAAHLLLPKDFVRFHLAGEGGTDPSDAGGTGLFDRDAGTWDLAVVDLARAPRSLLPTVRPADSVAGRITSQAAALTGLVAGTPVAVGGADTFCTRLGAGPLANGEACIYLGTAAWIAMPPPSSPSGAPATTGDGRPRVRGFGSTSTTGAALRWMRDLLWDEGPGGDEKQETKDQSGSGGGDSSSVLRPSSSYDSLTALAADVPIGAEGLCFLPHLMGERGPVAEPLAQGALVGLTLRHGRAHVARAGLEGTAIQIRRLLEASAGLTPPAAPPAPSVSLSPTALGYGTATLQAAEGAVTRGVVCGGGARSALWMQVLADVTGLDLRAPAEVEAGALGAAILAAAAAGVSSVGDAQARMVNAGATYTPHPDAVRAYAAVYHRYVSLDNLLMPWFRSQDGWPR